MENKQHPLIIIFYLDRELMQNKEIMVHFSQYVDKMITEKEANMMAFFIPTDGEERVECINPALVEKVEMDRINNLVEDLRKNFDLDTQKLEDEPEV